jgi:hypothetical protein
MKTYNTFPLEVWVKIFEDFRQVVHVRVDSSAKRLNITIRGRKGILRATQKKLTDYLNKFNGNPNEVATYLLKKHGVLVYYQDTLVGFFDIQAYSYFIKETKIEEAIQRISLFFSNTISKAGTDILDVKLDHWILSDSIILVVDTNRSPLFAGSLEVFLGTCSIIMQDAIKHGFPLRGAIGGGDFYKDGEIMVSSGLVDAALYEKEQDWLGAILTPKALQIVEKAKEFEIRHKRGTRIDFSLEKFKAFVRYGVIPWKLGARVEKPKETYYIKPFEMADENWASKYLPNYFEDTSKINNSHYLYAHK